MMRRSQIREQVFIAMFMSHFYPAGDMAQVLENYLSDPENECDEESREIIISRYEDMAEHVEEIDDQINDRTERWNTKRMGKVELSIIRLALYEMLYDEEIPTGVAINEAVELAKKYGQDNAGSFVNGILARFAQAQE